ncbi:MAG: sigma factor-like helix-turn-helix DNA-binding protein [bacterium]|nr:sigma factor-like helix-turn-helix DNA-binding protein [bacterium]
MDKRPKRRKHKDNPYELESSNNTYFVKFIDNNNISRIVEVSSKIYEVFDRFELDDLSELNEYDNHIEHSEVYEETLYKRTSIHSNGLDDEIIKKSSFEELYNAIKQLPEIQQRRIKMYYFDEMNMTQIAKEEECSKVAIKYSLDNAIKKLKEILKN